MLRRRSVTCLIQSLIIHASPPRCSIPRWMSLCLHFVSRLRRTEACSAPAAEPQPLGRRAWARAKQLRWRERKRGSNESSPSLQAAVINQINYGAATLWNPQRGNEVIRRRSQLNTQWVNEIINYLMIYSGFMLTAPLQAPPTTTTHLHQPPLPQRAFVLIES